MLELHYIINHPYTRIVCVLVISIVLSFIHRLDAFKSLMMYYVLVGVLLLMMHACNCDTEFHCAYTDYGFVLLIMAMLVLTYNNIVVQSKREGMENRV